MRKAWLFLYLAPASQALADVTQQAAETGSLWGPTLRMVLSLTAVLSLLGGCAYAFNRLREGGRFKGGLIEIVSGISLGNREKVVLLRVHDEEILVGISPSGMRPLHVMHHKTPDKKFSSFMENSQ